MNIVSKLSFYAFMGIILMSFLTISTFSETKQSKELQFNSKNGTVSTVIKTIPNNHLVIKMQLNDNLTGSNSALPLIIYDGPISMYLPDKTVINNSELLPNETDVISSVSFDPSIEKSKNPTSWSPVAYNIEFRNSATNQLTGILEKTEDDSAPVYYTWKGGSLFDKISDTTLVALVQALNYSDPSFQAMNVFPNPAIEQITISFNYYPEVDGYPSVVGKTLDYLKIYNLEGKEVYKEMNIPSRENKIIDIKSLPSGTYIIETTVNSANLKWQTMFSVSR